MTKRSISQAPRAVAALTGQPAPSGQAVYKAAVEGRIPAFYENGRWYFDDEPEAVQRIAAGLGIVAARQSVAA